ncbi:hypothetical protein [Photobacterium nomapromontoriensis]|uniref:hypothetical protein n=1 Tax=Photobacterium nomapromontoriensis TaxID=2910237 RepID=UPI003D110F22
MDIEKLSKELYEDLNGRITAVDYAAELVITFQCDDWNDYDVTRKFRITCHGVKESEVQPSSSGSLEFTGEHQLLWNHNEPHGYLYYSSKTENRHEILGRLWETHEIIFGGWRSLTDYANTYRTGQLIEFCKGANGQLAHGPKPLLEAYEHALVGKIKTNYVFSYQPEGGYKALVFDSCFVICRSVEVEEISSLQTA